MPSTYELSQVSRSGAYPGETVGQQIEREAIAAKEWNQYQAAERARPLTEALTREEQFKTDPTRRTAFGEVAGRGFFGGLANQASQFAVSNLHSQYETKRQGALSSALNTMQQEDQFKQQMDVAQQQADAAKEANKPWWDFS